MTQKITIEVINHKSQRYETCGDWQFKDDNNLLIRVSNLNDTKMNCCVALHELIEALLCKFATPEVTEKVVDEFDFAFEKNRKRGDTSEPGEDARAPYFEQHLFASGIERAFAYALKVNWEDYETRIDSL